MELTQIRGIGDTYGERLREAGIRSVSDLAWTEDLSTLSDKTDIPPARLAEFRVEAVKLAERAHRAPADVIHSVASAVFDLAEEIRLVSLQQAARGLHWLRGKLPPPGGNIRGAA
jgi:hypothetical protein